MYMAAVVLVFQLQVSIMVKGIGEAARTLLETDRPV